MKFSIGIVGLPNVGKSTLFKALTKKQVDTSNYPFCTVDPNVGVVAVPDERLDQLAGVLKPDKVIPTTIEFVDIAGLVAGAHKGEGLGNQFLSHIREVKTIIHLVRAFEDKNVSHVAGAIDPINDVRTIDLELLLADLAVIKKRLKEIVPKAKTGEKEAKEQMPVLEKIKQALEKETPVRDLNLSEGERLLINEYNLLTQKPVLYVFNIGEQQISSDSESEAFKLLKANYPRIIGIEISAKIESELEELGSKDTNEYMKEIGLRELGLSKLIKTSYKLLDLITFFTTENNILQAWAINKGSQADQAAGIIHTDFQEKFIKAEVVSWQDLVAIGSMTKARQEGLVSTEGKGYKVQDGDVIYIKI